LIPYREPTRQELTVLRRSFSYWGIFDYVHDKAVLVREIKSKDSIIKEVYLATIECFKMISEHMPLSHTGLLVGHLRRRSFVPSMAGSDLIARVGSDYPFVLVNQTAEALVLYGRDIMYGSIIDYGNLENKNKNKNKNNNNNNKNNNIILIVLNKNRVAIGLGITTVSFGNKTIPPISDKKIAIKTLADAGHYLRNQG
jgi:ribosome biogenesis protein Nip4